MSAPELTCSADRALRYEWTAYPSARELPINGADRDCPECNGMGEIWVAEFAGHTHVDDHVYPCELCTGTGDQDPTWFIKGPLLAIANERDAPLWAALGVLERALGVFVCSDMEQLWHYQVPQLALYYLDGELADVLDPADSCSSASLNEACGGCSSCMIAQVRPDEWGHPVDDNTKYLVELFCALGENERDDFQDGTT